MKKILSAGLLFAAVTLSQATPVNITVSPVAGPGTALVVASAELSNYGDLSVFNWLTSDVADYNTLTSAGLPAPVAGAGGAALSTGSGSGNSFTLDVTGFSYLVLHWGGQGGGWEQAFYTGGSTGVFTFDNSDIGTGTGPSVGAISFERYYGPTPSVPDGGYTVIFLGTTLLGIGVVARMLKKQAVQN